MALVEAVSGRRALEIRPVGWNQPLRAFQHGGRGVYGGPPEGGKVSFPVAHYFEPLRPLHEPSDLDRYLAIDSFEEMFGQFKKSFADPADWASSGHLIVVTGDRGCGKTSLIQRCAHWLEKAPQQDCEVVVLDLSYAHWQIETKEERLNRVFGRMIEILGTYITQDKISLIENYRNDMDDAFHHLGRALGSRQGASGQAVPPIALVVLLPGYPKPPELTRYFDLVCPGVVFFAEAFEVEDIRIIQEEIPRLQGFRTGAYHLMASALKRGDADLLADWIRHEWPGRPDLPAEVVRDQFERLVALHKISVLELARLAWGVLRFAADDSADQVTDAHFVRYYEQLIYKGSG